MKFFNQTTNTGGLATGGAGSPVTGPTGTGNRKGGSCAGLPVTTAGMTSLVTRPLALASGNRNAGTTPGMTSF